MTSEGETNGSSQVNMLTNHVLREPRGLDELANVWDLLPGKAASPIQRYAWVRTCAEACMAGQELCVVVVGDRERPRAVAPLVRRGSRPVRLGLLGVAQLGEPMDLLYTDSTALDFLARTLAGMGHPLCLERIPADSPAVGALRSAYRGRGVVICRPNGGCPWIPLDASWQQPEQHFSSRRRADIRRMQRRAEGLGTVSSEILSPAPKDLEAVLDEAFKVEAACWKGQQGTALAKDPIRGAFYRGYAAASCQAGILRICFLRIGGRPVAMEFAVECGDAFWLLKIGYDEEFTRCSPGTLLMLKTVQYAASRGLRSYEFLGNVDSWTQVWTQHVRSCVAVRVYPANLKGVAACISDGLRVAARRLCQMIKRRGRA